MNTQPLPVACNDVAATGREEDATTLDVSPAVDLVDIKTKQLSLDKQEEITTTRCADEGDESTSESNWTTPQDQYAHLLPHLRPNKFNVFPVSALVRKQLDPMMRITHVFDMDGFFVRDKFYCKEAALVEVGNGRMFYEHFKLPFRLNDLLLFEQQEVNWVTNAIHGIPFENKNNETLTQDELGVVVRSFLVQGFHTPRDIVVGYKGGNIEKDLLDEMGIQSFNMELIGCPKYDYLVSALEYKPLYELFKTMDLPQIFCNLHVKTTSKEVVHHCAKSEVCMFRRWYLHYYLGL